MKTPKNVPQQEDPVEKKKMTRGKAIKKTAGIAIAAGTMMTLLNSKQALAYSGVVPGPPAPSDSSIKNYTTKDW